jgi:truncated hemoglobin YjbI
MGGADPMSGRQMHEEIKASGPIQSNGNMPVNSQTKSGLPATIYEKLGGDDGIKIVVDSIFLKIMADPVIRPFFMRENLDVEKIKQHFIVFMTHITSTTESDWTGRSLAETHRHYPITDEIFDAFNSHCI